MRRAGLVCCAVMLCMAAGAYAQAVPRNRIDRLVFDRLAADGFSPSDLCSDEVFLRRAWLDVAGTLPEPGDVRRFLSSTDPDKRAKLIEDLLARPEFADYLALKWCDLLRVKAEFPSNLWPNAVQAYHRWIRDAIRDNMPYDQFARALLTGSGSNFRDPPANFYRPFQERTPRRILETVALVFMGTRLEHSGWSEADLAGMDAFFTRIGYKKTAEWKEEIVYFDPATPVVSPVPVGGPPVQLGPFDDPRVAFAAWLTAPDNPWFAKTIVNRVWYWLTGRGLIHEPDDIHPGNPAWSPELLAFLERELVENRYDLKHIYRLILNSASYQLSSVPTPGNAADTTGFSRYRLRRLDAEVLIDAICRITGTAEEYSSAIPEPFTFIPLHQRSITLADGSIKSAFLEMFGRPGRDTSYESERNNSLSTFQTLHLLNSSHILDKINGGPGLKQILREFPDTSGCVDELYIRILSRLPTGDEKKAALDYVARGGLNKNEAAADLAWALMNTTEFILKH